MIELPWWATTAAKMIITVLFFAGAGIFWILTEMARDPQAGGSVPVLFGVAVVLGVLGLIGLLSLGSDIRQLMSE